MNLLDLIGSQRNLLFTNAPYRKSWCLTNVKVFSRFYYFRKKYIALLLLDLAISQQTSKKFKYISWIRMWCRTIYTICAANCDVAETGFLRPRDLFLTPPAGNFMLKRPQSFEAIRLFTQTLLRIWLLSITFVSLLLLELLQRIRINLKTNLF